MSEEPLIAVFVDFENLAIGVQTMKWGEFQIELVLKRLLEKGRIVYKRAYCDWSNYRDAVREFHRQGIELIDIPHSQMSGKNSADIRMVVDAIDLAYAKEHIDTFALLSGDSDFSPLVSKLKENEKRVLGCGVKNSTSPLLVGSCDEFIIYDDLVKKRGSRKRASSERDPVTQVVEMVESLDRDYDVLWGSMIKQALRRVNPGFSETAAGFRNFNEVLEAAEKDGHLLLEFDEKRGNYQVKLPARRSR